MASLRYNPIDNTWGYELGSSLVQGVAVGRSVLSELAAPALTKNLVWQVGGAAITVVFEGPEVAHALRYGGVREAQIQLAGAGGNLFGSLAGAWIGVQVAGLATSAGNLAPPAGTFLNVGAAAAGGFVGAIVGEEGMEALARSLIPGDLYPGLPMDSLAMDPAGISAVGNEEAKQIIEREPENLDDVGSKVGYHDPSFFRRLFKRQTGLTPAAYRRKFSPIVNLAGARGQGR